MRKLFSRQLIEARHEMLSIFEAIDPTSVQKVEDLMAELAPEMTIIIVTHNMQQAARISDHTAFFLQEVAGEPATLIEYGETDAIFTSPMDKRTEDYITGRFG